MKNRDYKAFAKDEYYHVFNRGVAKEDIFRDENDYSNFMRRLKLCLGSKDDLQRHITYKNVKDGLMPRPIKIKPLPKNAFDLVSFCLMPNHFHFLIRQNTDLNVTNFILKLCTSYSMYFNKKYDRVGNLFQDAFKAINIDDNKYLLWLSAYIHQNPVVAGLLLDIRKWKWSSYSEYLQSGSDDLCKKEVILEQFKDGVSGYNKFIETSFKLIKQKKIDFASDLFLD